MQAMKNIILFRMALIGVSLFIVASILGGFQFEKYSVFSMLISETMAIDTPYGWILRYFFLCPLRNFGNALLNFQHCKAPCI